MCVHMLWAHCAGDGHSDFLAACNWPASLCPCIDMCVLTLCEHCAADGHSDFLAACKRRAEGKLSLEHSGTNIQDPKLCDCDGPFDVVILDMGLTQLVLALMQVSHTCSSICQASLLVCRSSSDVVNLDAAPT